jgi:hypothetical protein
LGRVRTQDSADLIGLETERHGALDPGQDRDIVKLIDQAFEPEPMDDIAGLEIDHHQAAAGLGVAFGQIVVQGQAREAAVAGP